MEKKYSRSHIGEVHRTKENLGEYTLKIIDGGSKKGYCTILIKGWTTEVQYTNIKAQNIRYPYHRSVCSIGFFGEGEYTSNSKSYGVWCSMLKRCYSEIHLKNSPTYKGVTVCKEWHNFQNFAKWFEENYVEGWHLDKDLLSADSKIYSPNTCIFIPQALNSFLSNTSNSSNTSGTIGVLLDKETNKWKAKIGRKTIGRYKNKKVAALMYKLARKKEANKWKKEMTGILPQHAIESIK